MHILKNIMATYFLFYKKYPPNSQCINGRIYAIRCYVVCLAYFIGEYFWYDIAVSSYVSLLSCI